MEQRIPEMTIDEFRALVREVVLEVIQGVNEPAVQQLKDFMNAREAAKFLNMALQTVYEKTCHKILPHYKYGNRIVFKRSELAEWMEKGRVSTFEEDQLRTYNSSRQEKERRALRQRNALNNNRD